MEQINNRELHDEDLYPDESILKAVLGKSYEAYQGLLEAFDEHDMSYAWKYYKDGKAWLCKAQKKTRTIVWMSAWKGFMKATIYIPEKYLEGLRELDIGEKTKNVILDANNVGKSKPCMFEIKDTDDLYDFNKVMEYKLSNK